MKTAADAHKENARVNIISAMNDFRNMILEESFEEYSDSFQGRIINYLSALREMRNNL